jgi:hypothetical protein
MAGASLYRSPRKIVDADPRPITGHETIPEDQVRTEPRITRQHDPRHPGGAPRRNLAAASQDRPRADPMLHRAAVHSIPVHRAEPTHRSPEAEDVVMVHGVPVNRKKLAVFSETLRDAEHRIAADPRSVGPELRRLSEQLLAMHLDHIRELNDASQVQRESWKSEFLS